MAGDVADEHADLGVGDRGDAEEIATDGFSRLVAVDELKRALFRRHAGWKARILLRQHGELDFARGAEVFLHERILGAQFLPAAGEFAGGAADLLLGALAFGDVLDRAFVVKQLGLRVTDGAAVLRNPDDRSVLAVNAGLEAAQGVVLLHEPDKFLAAAVLDVKAAGDVLDAGHQLHRRVVTVDARERHVGQQIMTVRRGAENAFHQMVEEAVVILLFIDKRDAFLLPRHRAMDGVPQRGRRQLLAPEIILRAAVNGLGQKGFVLARPDDDHRLAGRLRGEPGDLKQRRRIRLRDLKHDGVEMIRRDHRQPRVGARLHRHRHFKRGAAQQIADTLRHRRVAADK